MEAILGGLPVFDLRLTDVTLSTMRILMTVRGRQQLAALIGFVKVTIFVAAISQVIGSATGPWHVLGYAGGCATGTAVGMTIEERLALGFTVIRIISTSVGKGLGDAIRRGSV